MKGSVEQDWLLKVERDIAYLKTKVDDISQRLPFCEKDKIKEQIGLNTKLIFLVLAGYIPLIIAIFNK